MTRDLIAAGAKFAALFLATPALAQQNIPYHDHGWMWGGGWGGMIIGPLMMIAFVVVAVAVVVLLVRWIGGDRRQTPATPQGPSGAGPLDILRERFARGEIDKAEFEERKRALES